MSASNAISREEILRLCSKDGSPEFRSSVYILTRILNDQEAKGVPALEKHRKATSTSALCERAKIFNASLTAEFLDLKWKCWQSRKNDFLKARRAKSTEVTRAQEHLVRDVDAMQIVYGKAVALFIADFPDAQNCWKNSTTRAAVMVFVVNPRNRVGEQTPRTSAKRPANDSPGPPKRHCPTIADVYSSDGSTENHHADPTQAEASGATNTPPNKTFNQVETVTIDSYSTPDAAFQPETCGVWTGNQSCPTISPSANEDPDLTDIPHDPCDIPHNLSGTPHHLTDIVHEGFNSTLRQRIAQLFTAQIYQFSLENRAVPGKPQYLEHHSLERSEDTLIVFCWHYTPCYYKAKAYRSTYGTEYSYYSLDVESLDLGELSQSIQRSDRWGTEKRRQLDWSECCSYVVHNKMYCGYGLLGCIVPTSEVHLLQEA